MINRLLITALLVLLTDPICIADTIRLHGSVRAPRGRQVVMLSDIAEIQGDHAEGFARVVICNVDQETPVRLGLETIRTKLAGAGCNFALVDLSGGTTIVRSPSLEQQPPRRHSDSRSKSVTASADDRTGIQFDLGSFSIEGSPLWMASRMICNAHDIDTADLRIVLSHCDVNVEAPHDGPGRLEVDPTSSLTSNDVSFTIRTWEDGRISPIGTMRLKPLIRTMTAHATEDLQRGDVVEAYMTREEIAWLAPVEHARTITQDELIGSTMKRSLDSGDRIARRDVGERTLVRRGDSIVVRQRVGLLAISLEAVAQEDASEGETIRMIRTGSKRRNGRSFMATVTGPGEAIVQ